MIVYPDELNIIFEKLHQKQIRVIIVGGFVRDTLLGIVSKDIDIELYGISSIKELHAILEEFGSVSSVGKSFAVCILSLKNITIDFSLPRIDNKVSSGHRGFKVKVDSSMDFRAAALRRDFTMNAMGYDVQNKKLLDPYGGFEDLKRNILQEVDKNTFIEDPLRILRAIQFCARFNLKMSKELFSLCKDMVDKNLLAELSKERIFLEYKKLLCSAKPSIGFKLLKKLEILKLEDLDKILAEVDYFAHHKTDNSKTNTVIMLTILSYRLSQEDFLPFVSKFTAEKKTIARVLLIRQNYQELCQINQDSYEDITLYRLALKVKISELLLFCSSIELSINSISKIEKRAKKLNIFNAPLKPLIQGRDIIALGIKASSKFSKILDNSYEAQLNGFFSSKVEATLWLKDYLKNS